MFLSPCMVFLFPLAMVAGVYALRAFFHGRWLRRRREVWSGLAGQHGWSLTESRRSLPLEETSVQVEGLLQGRRFWVRTEERRHRKHRVPLTVARWELGDRSPGRLSIPPDGLTREARREILERAQFMGDAEFIESAVDLKRASPELRHLLEDARVQQHLRALCAGRASLSIIDGRLEVERTGLQESPTELRAFVAQVMELGEALHAASTRTVEQARG
jgi:hypothetical protein